LNEEPILSEKIEITDECLMQCPSGILVQDDSGVIKQLNPALEQMLGISPGQLLGHTRENLSPPICRDLLNGEGVIHLSGPGLSRESWLRCSHPVKIDNGSLVRFFEDVTETTELRQENLRLSRQIEELTITDELTGLANQRALQQALSVQVTRSRRYQNPLSLAVIKLQDALDSETEFSDEIILATSQCLRDRLRWADLIARWDHSHFFIILPETKAQDGIEMLGNIQVWFSENLPTGVSAGRQLSLLYGIAEWEKGNDPRALMERAVKELNAGTLPGQ
jgi:diguanylate cyclase (GGDEF)-like protein